MERREAGDELVFGLDIGTRNVVGTVGFKQDKEFIVLAQYSMEHETRAMLDGQIHDIGRVGNTIRIVKENLEQQIGQELTSVCIAAAGRVLKTVTTHIEYEFETESVVRAEDIHTLDLLGIERAQAELKEKNDTKYKFYCVGYSVVKYFLNDEIFSNLEGHKAEKISEDIIVTFLPEDVVDGLYSAVAIADLSVANMTLEPIAAIDVAIPENFRMLNIALVDVGAGTSDICITRDGSIIAYGMIPLAGDELTELIVQSYLVDFAMAEHIKLASTKEKEIEYTDIMTLKHTLKSEEVWKLTEGLVDRITTDVANKIKELNGDTTVSATFVVGGGGKIHGFTEMLADKLELPNERVALRGEEVLKEITFEQPDIQKDPLLVTPIGICLNYYEQRNSFIMVHFNGERIKLYDNGRLTIVDAAMQAGFPNEYLFPKRGKEINFTVNGSPRIARGEAGDSAIVKVNDKETNINAPLVANSYITVEPSTAGEAAVITIDDLAEYTQETVTFEVNGKTIHCPKFVEVNGSIEVSSYHVQEGDVIETRNFYTVEQLAEFMDVEINQDHVIRVNNRPAELNTLLYENFTVEWTASAKGAEDFAQEEPEVSSQEPEPAQETLPEPVRETEEPESIKAQEALEVPKEPEPQMSPFEWASQGGFFDEPPKQEDVSLTEETQMTQEANPQEETLHQDEPSPKQEEKPAEDVPKPGPGPLPKGAIQVEVNGNEILLTG
ncbi:MAG: rod shape-determining protein, partial [Lachnospiraceae bacterium]|nr:rod shape-determining protein [Lachnospiraceae bacterium]